MPELVRFLPPDLRMFEPVLDELDLPSAEAACVGRLPIEILLALLAPDALPTEVELGPLPTESALGN